MRKIKTKNARKIRGKPFMVRGYQLVGKIIETAIPFAPARGKR
jgi:hypothetical protein